MGFALSWRGHLPPARVKSASSSARSKALLLAWYSSVGMTMPTSPKLSRLMGSRPRTASATVSRRKHALIASRRQNTGTRRAHMSLKTGDASSSLFDRSFSPEAMLGKPGGASSSMAARWPSSSIVAPSKRGPMAVFGAGDGGASAYLA